MLTANSTAAAAAKPVRLVKPQGHQQQPAGGGLQAPRRELGHGGDRPSRGWRKTVNPARTRLSAPRTWTAMAWTRANRLVAGWRRSTGARSSNSRSAAGAIATAMSASSWPAKMSTEENMIAPEDGQGDDVEQRLGDQRSQHHREVLAGTTGTPGHDQGP